NVDSRRNGPFGRMLILGPRVTTFCVAESNNRWYNRHLFQQRAPSLFRPFHLVVQNCFLHQSFLDMLPPLLPKGKQNSIVRYRILLSLYTCCCQGGFLPRSPVYCTGVPLRSPLYPVQLTRPQLETSL